MEVLTQFIADNWQMALAIGGAAGVLPAAAALLNKALNLPYVRGAVEKASLAVAAALWVPFKAVRAAAQAAGVFSTQTLGRILGPRVWQAVEDELQTLVETAFLQPMARPLPEFVGFIRWLLWTPYCRGLDSDDKADDKGAQLEKAAATAALDVQRSVALGDMREDNDTVIQEIARRIEQIVGSRVVQIVGNPGVQRAARFAVRKLVGK